MHGVLLARRTYNVALKKYRRNPLPELHRDLQEAHNSYAEVCRLVRNASWDKWITEINTTPNVRDMWRRIRSASGTTPRPPTHPEPDMEAARLCVEFTDRSSAQNLPLSTQFILADLAPMREAHINAAIQEEHQTDRAFNLSELEMVLDGLHDTAPGADTVSYSMIKNAPLGFRHLLLRLINQSFQEGKLPEVWKTARIVPIPKPKKKGAFRPISLLPVKGKLMERMVLNRLRWTAEPLCNQALGFRHGTGTTDAVATVLNNVSTIKALRPGCSTRSAAVFLDLEKAFELVSSTVVLNVLAKKGIKGKLLSWIRSYLEDRKGTVVFQGHCSDVRNFDNGTPQGGSLSPTLFNYVINEVLEMEFEAGIHLTAYADDLAVHGISRNEDSLWRKMTSALRRIEHMVSTLGLKFAPEKTEAVYFRFADPSWTFNINRQPIRWSKEVRYLGVIVDQQLTFASHAKYARSRAQQKLNALKVMGTLSGVNARILRQVYIATVQSTLEYGAITFGMMSKSSLAHMQVIQNQAMRVILGVPKSTSAASTGRELDILPIECRANIRRARFMLKVKSQAHHPLHDAVCTPPRRRHGTDWIQEMHQCYADLMENNVNVDPGRTTTLSPWEDLPYTCRAVGTRTMSPDAMRMQALQYINNPCPDATRTYYTDGSSNERRVGAAFVTEERQIFIRLNDDATVLDAEMTAIFAALVDALDHGVVPVIHTDSLNAVHILRTIKRQTNTTAHNIARVAESFQRKPIINWVPAHVGIPGNELADRAAKKALRRRNVKLEVNRSQYKAACQIRVKAAAANQRQVDYNAGVETQWHKTLKLDASQRKHLMMMDRGTQKAIWKLRFRSKTYAQAARQEDAHCKHCDSNVSCICDHWLHECPAMAVHHMRLRAYLPDEQKHFRGKQLSSALLNSQVKVKHRDLTLLLRRYPLPFQGLDDRHVRGPP